MGQFEGMDVEHVQGLGNQLTAQSQTIESIVRSIDGLVGQLGGVWHGTDATAFHGWWQQQHKPALLHAATSIAGLGQSAHNNASDQGTVSMVVAGAVGVAAAGAAAKGHASGPASPATGYTGGPQHLSNSKIADAAEAELRDHPGQMTTGWNQPGECMVAAQRWVKEAGGQVNTNGQVAGSYSGVATQVPLDHVQRGDVIQYVDPGDPNNDWAHVHTVVVTSVNSDGSYQIIERNYDLHGSIRAVPSWTPSPAKGWTAEAFRYGDTP